MASLERGDEIVLAKFSNALRGSRELAAFIEFCRVKVVRIISIHDKVDSRGDLFPETKVADVLEIFGALPEECAALRKASAHISQLKQNINQPSKENNISKAEREKTIVAMYNNGHSIDDIWKVSGFSSRSSVFRILNKYGVSLNRGKFSGPLGNVNRNKNKVNYKTYCIFEKKQYLCKVNMFDRCVLQTNSKKKASSRLRI